MPLPIPAKTVQTRLPNTHEDADRLLGYAKSKLLAENIPMQLKAISYLRLCCIAIQKLCHASVCLESHDEVVTNHSYSALLESLHQHDPEWWKHCWVSDRGVLNSNHAAIDNLLQSLAYFIEMFTPKSIILKTPDQLMYWQIGSMEQPERQPSAIF